VVDLELDIVAEGIENADQLEFLTEVGWEHAQGFYIGKPAPAAECESLFPHIESKKGVDQLTATRSCSVVYKSA